MLPLMTNEDIDQSFSYKRFLDVHLFCKSLKASHGPSAIARPS